MSDTKSSRIASTKSALSFHALREVVAKRSEEELQILREDVQSHIVRAAQRREVERLSRVLDDHAATCGNKVGRKEIAALQRAFRQHLDRYA